MSTVLLLPDQHRINSKQQYRTTTNHLKQYRTTITPLASKQYSTYAVTIVPFSCLPREAPFLREIRTLRQVAHKLHGYIYTTIVALHGAIRHGRYIFMRSSTSFGHRRSSAPRTYIYFFVRDIYIIGTSRNGNFWRSPNVARTMTISNVFVCFLCFVSFSRSFVNKD